MECKEIDTLKKAYEDVIWMAIRYANGRSNYTPSMVRGSIKEFQKVFPDWKPQNDSTLKSDRRMDECITGEPEYGLKGDWLDDLVE